MSTFLSAVKQEIEQKKQAVIQTFDVPNKAIAYAGISSSEVISVLTEEEAVRAYLIARLIADLGYKAEHLELEKRYKYKIIGRHNKIINTGAEADVLVKDAQGNPFLFIEVKAPHEYDPNDPNIESQLFNTAEEEEKENKTKVKYLVYYSIDATTLTEKVIVIDFEKYRNYNDWRDAASPSTDAIPARYEKAQKEPYKKNGAKSLRTKVTKEEIGTLQRTLHNVLWGGGGTNDSDIFYSLVNLILAKIQDEDEKDDQAEYDFQVKQYGDETEEFKDLFQRVNDLYRRALREKLNKHENLDDQFVVNSQKFSAAKLRYTVSQLEGISLIEARDSLGGKDILGDLFEGITRDGFKQTKGQFFTPINIVKFMLYGIEIDRLAIDQLVTARKLPYIIDPSCGSGTFLIEAMKIITNEVGTKQRYRVGTSDQVKRRLTELMPSGRENTWARDYLYGLEHNFDLGTAVKVNMILHGDGAANIFVKDGLLPFRFYSKEHEPNVLKISESDPLINNKQVNGQFDIIVTNPPFSVELDTETKRSLPKSFSFSEKKNSENLFIERYYQLLKVGGRLAAVLPESVFDTAENSYIRLFLFKYFNVRAIVSLPQVSFEPYTSTKTSIVFADKKSELEIQAWNKAWLDATQRFNKLKTRVENTIDVYLHKKTKSNLPSIKNETEDSLRSMTLKYLRNYVDIGDEKLPLTELLRKYLGAVKEIGKQDMALKELIGLGNPWWIFGEVAPLFDKRIFMADAENVGFKRTKRGERLMPNNLFDIESAPSAIDVNAASSVYDDEIEKFEGSIKRLTARIVKAKVDGDEETVAKISSRLLSTTRKFDEIKAEHLYAMSQISKYYLNGRLLPQWADRTELDLRRLFDLPLLSQFKSYDVTLRDSKIVTILDAMRQASIWN